MDEQTRHQAVEWKRVLGLSRDDLLELAEMADDETPLTLRQVLARIEEQTGEPAAKRYPQGRRDLIDGRAGVGGLAGAEGFGDRPYTDLRTPAVRAHCERVRALVARKKTTSSRVLADPDDDAHGKGSYEQLVRAARCISHLLVVEGWLRTDPLRDLQPLGRTGPTRDLAFTDDEMCRFVTAILRRCADQELFALMWSVLRVTAVRNAESLGLGRGGVSLDPSYITVLGKGQHHRIQPMHRPVLAAAVARRDRVTHGRAGSGTTLWATSRGNVSGGTYDDWSAFVKDADPTLAGHEIGPHGLRHTAARQVNAHFGKLSDVSALYLGEKLKTTLGTVAAYLHSPYVDELNLRTTVAEELFGPLDDWPRLPEAFILRPLWDILERKTS